MATLRRTRRPLGTRRLGDGAIGQHIPYELRGEQAIAILGAIRSAYDQLLEEWADSMGVQESFLRTAVAAWINENRLKIKTSRLPPPPME
jgi:hypothetical protein